jgi:hypothetical protein
VAPDASGINPRINAIVSLAPEAALAARTRRISAGAGEAATRARGRLSRSTSGLPLIRPPTGAPRSPSTPDADSCSCALRAAGGRGRQDQHAGSWAWARTPSTRCSAPPATRGRWTVRPAASAAAPGPRWRPACCRSPTGPTTAAASATQRRSTTWWVCARPRALFPTAAPATSGTWRRWRGRWPARWGILR